MKTRILKDTAKAKQADVKLIPKVVQKSKALPVVEAKKNVLSSSVPKILEEASQKKRIAKAEGKAQENKAKREMLAAKSGDAQLIQSLPKINEVPQDDLKALYKPHKTFEKKPRLEEEALAEGNVQLVMIKRSVPTALKAEPKIEKKINKTADINKYKKEYRQKHKDEINAKQRENYQELRDKVKDGDLKAKAQVEKQKLVNKKLLQKVRDKAKEGDPEAKAQVEKHKLAAKKYAQKVRDKAKEGDPEAKAQVEKQKLAVKKLLQKVRDKAKKGDPEAIAQVEKQKLVNKKYAQNVTLETNIYSSKSRKLKKNLTMLNVNLQKKEIAHIQKQISLYNKKVKVIQRQEYYKRLNKDDSKLVLYLLAQSLESFVRDQRMKYQILKYDLKPIKKVSLDQIEKIIKNPQYIARQCIATKCFALLDPKYIEKLKASEMEAIDGNEDILRSSVPTVLKAEPKFEIQQEALVEKHQERILTFEEIAAIEQDIDCGQNNNGNILIFPSENIDDIISKPKNQERILTIEEIPISEHKIENSWVNYSKNFSSRRNSMSY